MNQLIDAHTHVNFAAYDSDREEVIKRALGAGVWMVNVGTQQDTSRKAVELAQNYEKGVYAAVGLHPIHTTRAYHDSQELGSGKGFISRGEKFDYGYYKKLASDPKVVAIGECGLDYYRLATSDKQRATRIKEKQKEVFVKQVELATELKKPLMIHCRSSKNSNDAHFDILGILRNNPLLSRVIAVMHFYVGDLGVTKKLIDIGSYFTFGGVITFTRDYDEVIKYIPLSRILTETDAPYVAPEPHRGKRNEPAYVIETAKKLAEIRRIDFDKIAEQTKRNAIEVFGLLS